MNEFIKTLEKRRSIYKLDKNICISHERVQAIVEHALKHTPSAFNSQSARVVILFNHHHDNLWDTTKNIIKDVVPTESFSQAQEKLNDFKAAAGTILFYDDINIVKNLQNSFPMYADNFPIWAQQANGMLQSNIWAALAQEGVGASLQHYNPLIDEAVSIQLNIEKNWKLVAQMPFGNQTSQPKEKEFVSVTERIRVFV